MKQLTTSARMMRGLFLLILTVGGCQSAPRAKHHADRLR